MITFTEQLSQVHPLTAATGLIQYMYQPAVTTSLTYSYNCTSIINPIESKKESKISYITFCKGWQKKCTETLTKEQLLPL